MTTASGPRRKPIRWAWFVLPPVVLAALFLVFFGSHFAREIVIGRLNRYHATVSLRNNSTDPYVAPNPVLPTYGLDIEQVDLSIGQGLDQQRLPQVIRDVRTLNTRMMITLEPGSSIQRDLGLLEHEPVHHLWAQNQTLDEQTLRLIGRINSLVMLACDGSTIDNQGLQHLANLKNLKTLTLDNTNLTDDGLQRLRKLPSLGHLYISNTQVSDSAKEELLQAIPDLNISDD